MPKKTKKDKIMEFIGTSLNALSILGLIALVKNFVESHISSSEYNFILTVGDVMSANVILLISYAIVFFITKTALNTEKDKKLIAILKRWVVATVIFAVLIFSSIYFKNIIVIVPLWQVAISVLFIFIFGKMVRKRT